ncbi:DUF6544 family protein [Halomicroarcula sp. GCM10025817]|uniref:DUF6544 family protein n=1 Tax=Haloarcula TaxID=2237 RepID=UPI0023E79A19|nr:DUF6544 family protein [Halomicroarcula sp. SYNS111]
MNWSPCDGAPPGRRSALAVAGLLGTAGLVAAGLERRRFARAVDAQTDRLLTTASVREGKFDRAELDGLPAPVASYFDAVLEPGLPYTAAVRLEQTGAFRLGDADTPWRPLTATQYYTTAPPGFVWDATIDLAPLLPVRVVDAYVDGAGVLEARLLSALRVARAGPSPEMDAGELLRYLAEAVWFPTALLPSSGVEWEAVSGSAARATLEHLETSATAVFHFDDDGLVERVTADRYRQSDDAYAPWTGRFEDYQVRNGRLVPTRATVEWALPDGPVPYWRGTLDAIEHRTERVRSAPRQTTLSVW